MVIRGQEKIDKMLNILISLLNIDASKYTITVTYDGTEENFANSENGLVFGHGSMNAFLGGTSGPIQQSTMFTVTITDFYEEDHTFTISYYDLSALLDFSAGELNSTQFLQLLNDNRISPLVIDYLRGMLKRELIDMNPIEDLQDLTESLKRRNKRLKNELQRRGARIRELQNQLQEQLRVSENQNDSSDKEEEDEVDASEDPLNEEVAPKTAKK